MIFLLLTLHLLSVTDEMLQFPVLSHTPSHCRNSYWWHCKAWSPSPVWDPLLTGNRPSALLHQGKLSPPHEGRRWREGEMGACHPSALLQSEHAGLPGSLTQLVGWFDLNYCPCYTFQLPLSTLKWYSRDVLLLLWIKILGGKKNAMCYYFVFHQKQNCN